MTGRTGTSVDQRDRTTLVVATFVVPGYKKRRHDDNPGSEVPPVVRRDLKNRPPFEPTTATLADHHGRRLLGVTHDRRDVHSRRTGPTSLPCAHGPPVHRRRAIGKNEERRQERAASAPSPAAGHRQGDRPPGNAAPVHAAGGGLRSGRQLRWIRFRPTGRNAHDDPHPRPPRPRFSPPAHPHTAPRSAPPRSAAPRTPRPRFSPPAHPPPRSAPPRSAPTRPRPHGHPTRGRILSPHAPRSPPCDNYSPSSPTSTPPSSTR